MNRLTLDSSGSLSSFARPELRKETIANAASERVGHAIMGIGRPILQEDPKGAAVCRIDFAPRGELPMFLLNDDDSWLPFSQDFVAIMSLYM